MRCPDCDGIGRPIAVEERGGSVTVELVCPYCKRKWKHTRKGSPS